MRRACAFRSSGRLHAWRLLHVLALAKGRVPAPCTRAWGSIGRCRAMWDGAGFVALRAGISQAAKLGRAGHRIEVLRGGEK